MWQHQSFCSWAVFWGGQTIFWTGQKAISTLSIPKFLFKLDILYLKSQKCQIPEPGKCLVLPFGADAHSTLTIRKQKQQGLSNQDELVEVVEEGVLDDRDDDGDDQPEGEVADVEEKCHLFKKIVITVQ